NNLTSLFSIASGATVTISRLTLESGVGTNGGAISSAGDLTLDSVRIINSSAAKGGAVYQSGSNLTVNKSYFLDNSTTSNGGAIYFGGDSLKVTSTGFELNSADGSGGAIAFAGATITIRNSTLTGNDAQVAGGGLAVLSGSGDAINLTLVNNTLNAGAPGSTLSHINVAGSGPLKIGNTIIEGTGAAPTDLPGISGSVTTAGTNLAGTATYLGLGALGDYGGVSPTYLLKPGSPAIDAGDSLLLPATDRDQRGLARFSDGNGDGLGDNPVDVGAFEIQHYQVTALQIRGSATGGVDDQGFGNPFDPSDDADSIASADVFVKLSKLGKADIGDAVGANNAAGGGSVSFGSKIVPGRIFLKGSELKVRRDVAIYGPGAKQMTIDGDARSPVMRVSEGAFAYVHGISLENGLATTGAGIVVESGGDVELDEVSVRGNVATTDGGGIAVLSGKSTVYRSALVENTAGQKGGGLYASSDSTVIIDTSTLSKNTAGTQGGGISAAGVLIIDSSALVDNTAVTSGPGLFMEDGIGTIQNSILSHAILPNAGADPIKVDSIKVEGGTVLSTGYNISDSTAAATDADLLVATGDKIVPTKPLLNLRGFNEGQTLSYAPTPESPAINAGKSFLPVVDGQLDQPGKKRVRGGVIDIGPVEFQNDPPIITILSAPSVVECSANNTATIKIRVQDPDGDLKSVTWSINGGTPVENVITPTPGTAQSIELTRTFALDQDFNYVVIKASDLVAVSTYNLAPIEVDDTTGPVFNTFPADQFIGTDSDSCSATFNPANYPATATDSCSASVQIQYAIGGSVIEETAHLPLGPTTVDVSATDDSGNTTLRSFILTVVDTTAPTISNVEDFNVSAAAYTTCGTSVDFGLGEEDVKDCSPVTLEYTLFD
ncbi:MAG TPA: choice-of-anchor Q domain-containing protein, partial [Oceanipulchritudo sp.]|nr:choice-of-anchor Q domain-containing protein [Oceanipulchritudo sp.]